MTSNNKDNKEEKTEVKQTEWRLPDFMAENLILVQRELGKQYQQRIQSYIKEIKDNYRNYEEMPNDEQSLVMDVDGKRIVLKEVWIKEQEAKKAEGGQQQGA